MSDHDWYRKTTWTPEDRDEFFAKLHRSRSQSRKARCARIQAHYLEKIDAEAALELLDQVTEEWPEPSELAQAYCQKAECFIRLGKKEEALQAFFESFENQRRRPNWQTSAFLDFGIFVVKNCMVSLYPVAEQVLDEFWSPVLLPVDRYKLHAVRAIIGMHHGDRAMACFHAGLALEAAANEHSGLRYHPNQGIVRRQDPGIERTLRALAEPPPLN